MRLGWWLGPACLWAASRGQFDDLDTPPLRMIADDEAEPRP